MRDENAGGMCILIDWLCVASPIWKPRDGSFDASTLPRKLEAQQSTGSSNDPNNRPGTSTGGSTASGSSATKSSTPVKSETLPRQGR